MPFTPFLAAIHLLLSTGASAPDAAAEKSFKGEDEAVISIQSRKPRWTVETHLGFTFNIDFATQGALSLAHVSYNLNVKPRGLTLSMDPTNGLLTVDYDKQAGELRVLMGRNSDKPVCSIPLALSVPTTRVLLRQREQLALYAIPQSGDHVTQVWLGTVGCVVHFRNSSQYELCQDLKITMGKREITEEEFRKGIKLNALDEINDIVVTGLNPAGEAFRHRYIFDYESLQKRMDSAYGNFLRAAGNTLIDGSIAEPKPPASPIPVATPSASSEKR